MIVPKVSLQGGTFLDTHRRVDSIDGQPGSYSPRPDKDRSQSLEQQYRRQMSAEREESVGGGGSGGGGGARRVSASPPLNALEDPPTTAIPSVERTSSYPLATLQDHEAWHRTESESRNRSTSKHHSQQPGTLTATQPPGSTGAPHGDEVDNEEDEREPFLPDFLSVRDCRVRGYPIGASNIIRGSKWDKNAAHHHANSNNGPSNEARQQGSRWFQRFPPITSVAVSQNGSHAAFGDESGVVSVLEAGRPTCHQRRSYKAHVRKANQQNQQATRQSVYSYYRGAACFEAYSSVIDPLNSVEVTPAISAMSFLPQQGNSTFLLTANEKMPKLFKLFEAYDCPRQPFRAVDMLGSKTIGPLISSQRSRTTNLRLVSKYALDHEYNVNSINATADGTQFYTSDELCVKLWSVEHPDTSLNVVTLPRQHSEGFSLSEGDESVRECIRSTHIFPEEPQLLFMCTSAGLVRVFDSRVSLRWGASVGGHQVFSNPQRRRLDGKFGVITNALTGGCALSPCGRYIAARDFLSVPLWDVRMVQDDANPTTNPKPRSGNSYVHRWEVHPNVRRHLDPLFESNLMVERFSVAFVQSLSGPSTAHQGSVICTGSFANSLYMFDPYTSTKSHIKASDYAPSSSTQPAGSGAGAKVRNELQNELEELERREEDIRADDGGDDELAAEREKQLDKAVERVARLTMSSMRRYYVPPPEHTLDALEGDNHTSTQGRKPSDSADEDDVASIDLDEESTISPSVPNDETGLSVEALWGARRVVHVVDTRRPGGGLWVAAGGSVSHLVL